MLAGLRLDGFIGGDDEQHHVDAAHAGQHVLDEALVAGDVHEAKADGGRQLQVGKAQVDGDAAALLFLQAVGVDSGERLHQRRLAMIDMTGRAYDDVFHAACYSVKVVVVALLVLVAGSLAFCGLAVAAAARFRRSGPQSAGYAAGLPDPPPISVLKPLAGVDDGLEENLRTFFDQNYPDFEILFAVRSASDPAVAVVERLQGRFPGIASRLIVTGEPPYANAKVYSLEKMLAAARHRLVVMADSDVRVDPNLLATLAGEFANQEVGVITCPYRAAPGPSFWSTLEAIGLNTDFIAGVLVARMLDGMKFALGPTIAARRELLAGIGGLGVLKSYLAEDFVLGKLAAQRGWQVLLSSYIIEHRIGAQPFWANWKHRLRWNRSTRRSRPWGYVGLVFTYPLPLALLCWAAWPAGWPLVVGAAAMRAASACATAGWVLDDPLVRRRWWLVPLQDAVSFLVWLAGFFGNTIIWRGRRYHLSRDGTFTPCLPGAARR